MKSSGAEWEAKGRSPWMFPYKICIILVGKNGQIEAYSMAQKSSKEKEEQQVARTERKEFEAELAENLARLPRRARNRQRTLTFIVLAILAALAGLFGWLVLLPSSTQAPSSGVPVGAVAPEFALPIY